MHVRVLKLGQGRKDVELDSGATLDEAVEASHFNSEGCSLSVNGLDAHSDSTVRENDLVVLTPRVEGGQSRFSEHGSR